MENIYLELPAFLISPGRKEISEYLAERRNLCLCWCLSEFNTVLSRHWLSGLYYGAVSIQIRYLEWKDDW
jgi:hypothetical protein